jgi:hypothetical protein
MLFYEIFRAYLLNNSSDNFATHIAILSYVRQSSEYGLFSFTVPSWNTEPMMPRLTYPGASDRQVFRTAIPRQQAKGAQFDVTTRILLTAVLLFAAAQLIW